MSGFGNPTLGTFPIGVKVDNFAVTDAGQAAPEIVDPGDAFDLGLTVEIGGAWLTAVTSTPGASVTITYLYNELGGAGAGTVGMPVTVPLQPGQAIYDRSVTKLTCNGPGSAVLPPGRYVMTADVEFSPLPMSGLANGLHVKVR